MIGHRRSIDARLYYYFSRLTVQSTIEFSWCLYIEYKFSIIKVSNIYSALSVYRHTLLMVVR